MSETYAPTTTPGLYQYECEDSTSADCANTCVGLEACEECQCVVLPMEAVHGPWGDFMDVLMCLSPIILLIIVTVKRNPWPTTISLPVSAVLMFLVRTMYLGSDPLLCSGCVILGIHEAITPLSIMAGAMTLFETMEATKCMAYMMREMKALTKGHGVAEAMLIFAFAYMVEGASGFGTPVALGAPMLVSTGHPPLASVVLLLVFNTVASCWGAVGTPIWFGFSEIELTESEILLISQKCAVAIAFGALFVIPWSLTILLPSRIILKNIVFVLLAIASVIGPTVGIAFVSYEFPTLMGGLAGCLLTAILCSFKIGLHQFTDEDLQQMEAHRESVHSMSKSNLQQNDKEQEQARNRIEDSTSQELAAQAGNVDDTFVDTDGDSAAFHDADTAHPDMFDSEDENNEEARIASSHAALLDVIVMAVGADHDEVLGPRKTIKEGYLFELTMRTFPIWGVVLILILTRVSQIGIKPYLRMTDPYFEILFGTYGDFRLSVSVVFQLLNILTYPNLNWQYDLFYTPFILPFIFVSVLTMIIFRKDMEVSGFQIFRKVAGQLGSPAIALFSALTLVQLMIRSGNAAPAFILGTALADWFRQGFVVLCPLLGALGSFFSGSTTVSNLTFGYIQQIAAQDIGVSTTAMLALQCVGGSAGSGISLNNIISACTIVGLDIGEGQILMRTAKFVFGLTTIATIVMLAFYFRF